MLVLNKKPKQTRDTSINGETTSEKKLTTSNFAFLKSLGFIV